MTSIKQKAGGTLLVNKITIGGISIIYSIVYQKKYIFFGHSYKSGDGDYKNGGMEIAAFRDLFRESNYDIEDLICDDMRSGDIFISTDTNEGGASPESRDSVQSLIAAIFYYYICSQDTKLNADHLNDTYRRIFEELTKKYAGTLTESPPKAAFYKEAAAGIKLSPIFDSHLEADINELQIMKKVAEPHLIDYSFCKANELFFNNEEVIKKIRTSAIAANIMNNTEDNIAEILEVQNRPYVFRDIILCMIQKDAGHTFDMQRNKISGSSLSEILPRYVKILAGLNHIGVIHGDLHLNNICITDEGRVSVIDFSRSFLLESAQKNMAAAKDKIFWMVKNWMPPSRHDDMKQIITNAANAEDLFVRFIPIDLYCLCKSLMAAGFEDNIVKVYMFAAEAAVGINKNAAFMDAR